MAKQTINVGTTANDRTGDPLRTAFTKVNSNFTELYANVATLSSAVVTDVSDLTDTQGLLFSGDYSDLANIPFIPTDISDLTDTSNLLIEKDHIELTGTYQGSNTVISFAKAPNTDSNTVFDQISNFISITRDVGEIGGAGGGIYNRTLEAEWNPALSPLFTLWNADGWDDLSDIEMRYYEPFRQVLDNNIGLNVVGKELIMKDTVSNEYYKIRFSQWAQGPSHTGAFAYTREKIDTTVPVGITFYDGSKLTKAPDTRVHFEQAYIGDYGDHIFTISEAGRQIYAYNNILEIPSFIEQNFKIGDTIQIITGDTASTLRPKANDNVEVPDATLYIQGETVGVSSFLIPARSMALLTKIRENTWQLSVGNTGSANTGDVTFDGVKVIGAGTASGDGNGYSTLELVPDNDLYGNDQYLIIDPTQPSHIHIRAGGTQDGSVAELYLGAELNNVKVRDGIGVTINNGSFISNFYNFIENTDYDTAIWSTDESGNHWLDITITNPSNPTRSSDPFDIPFYSFTQFPQNKIEVFDGTSYIDLFSNGQTYTLGNQYQLRIGVTQAPSSNPTIISSLTFRIDTLTQSSLQLENNTLDLFVDQDVYIYADQTIQLTTGNGNLRITTDDNTNSYTWYFTAQGYLQFPQGIGPISSKGKEGDEAGSVVFDVDYVYYCIANYTDGITDIWKRVAWSNDTW